VQSPAVWFYMCLGYGFKLPVELTGDTPDDLWMSAREEAKVDWKQEFKKSFLGDKATKIQKAGNQFSK